MIQHNGKDLEQLSLEETIEFEKVMLKKVLAASKSQMSGPIIDQLNLFIGLIKDHKQQVLSVRDFKDKNKKEDGVVLDTDPPVEVDEEKTD
tara:strand:+ start:919 stop:1191 length:273 start_codon:yes stop_codon:yes gene_type:complete